MNHLSIDKRIAIIIILLLLLVNLIFLLIINPQKTYNNGNFIKQEEKDNVLFIQDNYEEPNGEKLPESTDNNDLTNEYSNGSPQNSDSTSDDSDYLEDDHYNSDSSDNSDNSTDNSSPPPPAPFTD